MPQIIPPFVAPDDVTDDGKWARFVTGRVVFEALPASTAAAVVTVAAIDGIAATDLQAALAELRALAATLTPIVLPIRSVSASAALVPATDGLLLVYATGGPVTITLATPAAGQRNAFYIQKKDASVNQVILDPPGAITINGLSTFVLDMFHESVMVVFDVSAGAWTALNPFIAGS